PASASRNWSLSETAFASMTSILMEQSGERRVSSPMAQIRVDDLFRDQHLDMSDALIARPLEFLERQLRLAIGFVKLPGAAPHVPFRLEAEGLGDLLETHSIRACVRPGIRCIFELAIGHHLGHHLGNVANTVIVVTVA